MKRLVCFILLLSFVILGGCSNSDEDRANSKKEKVHLSVEEKTVIEQLSAVLDQLSPIPDSFVGTIEYWEDPAGDDFILYYTNAEKLYYSTIKVDDATVTNHGLVLTESVLDPIDGAPVIYINGKTIAEKCNLPYISFRKFLSDMNYSFESVRNETAENVTGEMMQGSNQWNNAEDIMTGFVDGTWWDIHSQRCKLNMQVIDSETVQIEINWPSGAANETVWLIEGKWDSDAGRLNYEHGFMNEIEYREGQTDAVIVRDYNNGTGYFYFENGYLYWVDYNESAGADCCFEPPTFSN